LLMVAFFIGVVAGAVIGVAAMCCVAVIDD
jgi:hypothetical protein